MSKVWLIFCYINPQYSPILNTDYKKVVIEIKEWRVVFNKALDNYLHLKMLYLFLWFIYYGSHSCLRRLHVHSEISNTFDPTPNYLIVWMNI